MTNHAPHCRTPTSTDPLHVCQIAPPQDWPVMTAEDAQSIVDNRAGFDDAAYQRAQEVLRP